jgi:glycosyltransferase 2 family protein
MRGYSYVTGALLGICLTALAVGLFAVRTEELPRVVSLWPLLAALGASVVTWWLQGLIYAVLARPRMRELRLGHMFSIEMAGLFVALVSPIRGAELPYKAYLFKRLGLSAGEGTNLVVTRVLLDAVVLTPAALAALALYSSALPGVQSLNHLTVGLAITVTLATSIFLICRWGWRRRGGKVGSSGSGWRARAGAKISDFLGDVRRSFASYWRLGQRATLVYALALTTAYWVFRLTAGPLAFTAVGWSGDWIPVIVAQLLLVSFVLPLVPTPGGGGVRELGMMALLSGHMLEGQLLSGLVVYSVISHWLPLMVAAFFAGHELWRGIISGGGWKAARRRGHAETPAPSPARPSYPYGSIIARNAAGATLAAVRKEAPSVRNDGSRPQRRAGI